MILTYEFFVEKLNEKIKSDADFCYELLKNVIDNPHRYTGIFRLSNAKTKLIQNVTQSREIKFGDFMEDIVTIYIEKMGYNNLNKRIGTDENGDSLNADQVFLGGDTVYLIEQKIRDDHDSTKKRGQYANFKKKFSLLERLYPGNKINATMWFIDGSLVKNKKLFYPDYVVSVKGEIWIIETKGGFDNSGTSEDIDIFSPKKFEVLKTYLAKHNLKGGFVRYDKHSEELCICVDSYNDDIHSKHWQLLEHMI